MNFNIWAALLAAVSSFFLGGLWYSKALFGPAWGRAAGIDPEKMKGTNPAGTRPGSSASASYFRSSRRSRSRGFSAQDRSRPCSENGALVGAAFVAASFSIDYQFADRKMTMWLIDGGYHTAQFVLFGLILGLWK